MVQVSGARLKLVAHNRHFHVIYVNFLAICNRISFANIVFNGMSIRPAEL